jgi:hypothetical protein
VGIVKHNEASLGIPDAGCGRRRLRKQPSEIECDRVQCLIEVANIIERTATELSGVPISYADARHRAADAATAVHAELRQLRTTSAHGAAGTARARLLTALTILSKELAVAITDLKTGRTQQQKGQGYVDTGSGVEKVNAAQSAVFAACPQSG